MADLPKIIMYARERYCPDVERARNRLTYHGLTWLEFDVEANEAYRKQMIEISQKGNVPQVIIGRRVLIEPTNEEMDEALADAGYTLKREPQPIIISSHNGAFALPAAMELLKNGGSAVDAVVLGCTMVEANPDDHTVGYSGLPNLLGQVELDASVMDGKGLRAGSVGALQGYQEAAKLAQYVMESLPHVLIGGDGTAQLAAEMGLQSKNLLTPEAEEIWKSRMDDETDRDASYMTKMREMVHAAASDPEMAEKSGTGEIPHGTVNFIAMDAAGNIATGVSTSGWAWKYPGRMGDSPVIGAGNYADNRWGAAACTGRGEMAQRCLTAHSVVTFMRFGMNLEEALKQAMLDLNALDDPFASEMNILAMDKDGNPGAASSNPEKTFAVMTKDMTEAELRPRTYVELDILKK